VAHPISKVRGLTVTFGPRLEECRLAISSRLAMTLLPPSGFAVSAEPASSTLSVATCSHSRSPAHLSRPHEKRPDDLTGGHGDAAFANWVWLASYSFAPAASMPTRSLRGPLCRANHVDSAAVVLRQRRCCRLSMIRAQLSRLLSESHLAFLSRPHKARVESNQAGRDDSRPAGLTARHGLKAPLTPNRTFPDGAADRS